MRYAILLVLAGCATGEVAMTPAENLAGCEETLRAAPSPQVAADCEYWRGRVAAEQTERERSASRRRRLGAAIAGVGGAYSSAGAPADPPTYHCSTNYLGGMDCRPQ